jgi:pimeloyl-ACP methyl ester carboxylesterase
MAEVETHTLEVEAGTLQYDVRGDLRGEGAERVLLMGGFPMDSTGFTTLATHFGDRPIVTYDPRTVGRSSRADGDRAMTPDDHAEDLSRLIEALDVGPVDFFGSSGGAVIGLALVTRHPEQVRTLVAHEPPIAVVLPDAELLLATSADIYATYQSKGMGPAMAKLMTLVTHEGPLPEDYLDQPDPDPAAFGLPTEDDGPRDDPMLGGSMRTTPQYQPDLDALAAASTRIVVGGGEESKAEMAGRAAAALAERMGIELTTFPSHHGGFLGDEFGMPGDPEGFAAVLRTVLEGR